jgi:hypothetical protein
MRIYIPAVGSRSRQARRAASAQTIARLQQGSSAAATTVLKLMLDAATLPSTRARCSESIISFASKAVELEDIEGVAALERAPGSRWQEIELSLHAGNPQCERWPAGGKRLQ